MAKPPVPTSQPPGSSHKQEPDPERGGYKALFTGPRWRALATSGGKTQRLLWASTGVKNPAYKDTMYVEGLIGRDTVNTIPPATMDAFRDHGEVQPDAIEQDVEGARAALAELVRHGISLDQITTELVKDGVRQFADAFDKLLGAVARRRRMLVEGGHAALRLSPGSPEMEAAWHGEMEVWRKEGRIRRLWAGDKSLWDGTDEDEWLGWLPVVTQELSDVDHLRGFAEAVKQGGFTDVVLLGMGGSSSGPEVLGLTFWRQRAIGWPRFHMLDSTDPAQIAAIEQDVTLGKALFIGSSKSGGTLEPNIFLAYFFDRVRAAVGENAAGEHFAAITDPGSALERTAKQLRFAHFFHGVPSIGGRYSVLSKFGLVPAASIGLDYKRLLETAQRMVRACDPDVPPEETGRTARYRHGHRGSAVRPRQGDHHRLAGDRRSGRLVGAASGGEYRQARAGPDPGGRGAARRARPLRQGSVLCITGAGKPGGGA